MIEINSRWLTFPLRNWRLKVDNYESSSHAERSDHFLQMDWNGALQKRETAKKYKSMAQKI
jgi:hypothetical protein